MRLPPVCYNIKSHWLLSQAKPHEPGSDRAGRCLTGVRPQRPDKRPDTPPSPPSPPAGVCEQRISLVHLSTPAGPALFILMPFEWGRRSMEPRGGRLHLFLLSEAPRPEGPFTGGAIYGRVARRVAPDEFGVRLDVSSECRLPSSRVRSASITSSLGLYNRCSLHQQTSGRVAPYGAPQPG